VSEPTVFIVDDDEAVLDSIAELVSSIGLRSTTFRSARQFLVLSGRIGRVASCLTCAWRI
jgi:FixJ family two-component response regulator